MKLTVYLSITGVFYSLFSGKSVEDQIPVSQDEEIKVELVKDDSADYTESTGKLVWKIKLKPYQTKKLVFSYTIKYNKSKNLSSVF